MKLIWPTARLLFHGDLMLTIKDIDVLESEALEKRIKEERIKQLDKKRMQDQERVENLKLAERAKKKAEQILPDQLQTIEGRIKNSVDFNTRKITHTIYEDPPVVWFTLMMIVPILMLQGFVCTVTGDRQLEITW